MLCCKPVQFLTCLELYCGVHGTSSDDHYSYLAEWILSCIWYLVLKSFPWKMHSDWNVWIYMDFSLEHFCVCQTCNKLLSILKESDLGITWPVSINSNIGKTWKKSEWLCKKLSSREINRQGENWKTINCSMIFFYLGYYSCANEMMVLQQSWSCFHLVMVLQQKPSIYRVIHCI